MHPDIVEKNPSTTQFLLWKLGKAISKKQATARSHARTYLQSIVRLVLHLAGFGLLTIAGFTWNILAGYVIAGLSCFLLSWLTASDNRSSTSQLSNGPGPGYTR